MEAQLVRKAVNRCAAQGKPFLFGVDFELREGFFVENPLVCRQIPFACGEITNVSDSFSGEAEITPRLEVLHTDREAYLRRFAVIRCGKGASGNSRTFNRPSPTGANGASSSWQAASIHPVSSAPNSRRRSP